MEEKKQQQDFSKLEIIINWDSNPFENVDPDNPPKQAIFSPLNLPHGDWNVYLGKVIEKIYTNRYRQIVMVLRKPTPEDLSEGNLNRQPLTASLGEVNAENAETIRKPATQEDLIRMRRELFAAEAATKTIYNKRREE